MDATSSQSKKRKFFQVSGKNDGSIEAQLEAIKAENARLKEESNLKDAFIGKQALKINLLESTQSNGDDVDEGLEAEVNRLKEAEAKMRAELEETHTKMEEEHNRHESQIAALKSTVVNRDNRISELEEQISALKDVKVDMVMKNNNNREEERAAFQLKINEMKKHVDMLTHKDAAWITVAQVAREKIATRDQEIKELQKQLSEGNAAKNELMKKIAAVKAENNKFKPIIEAFTQMKNGQTNSQ